jgi:uncharacterized protein YjbI with pentapeptide repeats
MLRRSSVPLAIRYAQFQMANSAQILALSSDVDEWNERRALAPDFRPDLSGANLHAANLVAANLTRSDLRGADLSLANLTGADIRLADLRGANLVGARLIGADFEGADLRGTDLSTAEDLTMEQLAESAGDETTRLPDDTPRPARWIDPQIGR